MEFLKDLFGDKALTFDEFSKAVGEKKFKLADLSAGKYVERAKFNEIDTAKTNAEKLLDEATKKLEGYDPTWKEQLETAKTEAAEQIKKINLDNAVNLAIANAKPMDAAIIKPLIDMGKVAIDNGNLVGFNEQITTLKASHPYLFAAEQNNPPARTGTGMGHTGNSTPDYSQMTDAEYYAAILKKE